MDTQPITAETIYDSIKSDILSLKLAPGAKLSEMAFAGIYGCTRTPVRTAFQRLCQAGYLEVKPQVGTFVPEIDPEHAEQCRFIRESIDLYTLKQGLRSSAFDAIIDTQQELIDRQALTYLRKDYIAFNHLDVEFHSGFYHAIGKSYLIPYLGDDDIHYMRLRFLAIRDDSNPMRTIVQHQDILNAIKQGSEAYLEKAVTVHLNNLYRIVGAVLKSVNPPDSYHGIAWDEVCSVSESE